MKKLPLNDAPYYGDFREMLDELARKYGDQAAFTSYSRKGEEQNHSYDDLLRDVEAFGEGLHASGLAGAHVAIAGANSYSWLVAFLGIAASGGVAVCIDVEQADDTVREMISQADAQAVVVSEELLPVVRPLPESAPRLAIVMDAQRTPPNRCFETFCRKGQQRIEEGSTAYRDVRIDGSQTAAIFYSSGTTSTAKPVMLSHRAMCTNAGDMLAMVSPPKRAFACLPFYHAYGMTCAVLASMIAGLGVCINGDLKTMGRDLARYRPGLLFAVPLMAELLHRQIWDKIEKSGRAKQVRRLMKWFRFAGRPERLRRAALGALDETEVGSIRMIVCGGAPLAPHVGRDLVSFGITVLQGYGITECAPVVTVNRTHDFDVASVGHTLPHVELKIQDGEVLIRGGSLMNGYYGNPGLTEQAFCDGWFKTGDLGHINDDGHLYITGRKKNLIVLKNGKKIPAEEVEARLQAVPLVGEVVAYGASGGSSADDVKLAVMVYPDPQRTEGLTSYEILAQLQAEVDKLNGAFPSYKQIQMVNIRREAFEKTASQKIKRQVLHV